MVRANIEIPDKANRILNIVKGKYGFKTKEQACIHIVLEYEQNLEPEIRPEYVEKIKRIEKGKFHSFKNKKEFLDFVDNEL